MTPTEERDLIRQARNGSAAAFAEIVDHHQHRLLRYLMLRGLQQADAEDAAQKAFVTAWEKLDTYREKWRFSTWLYTLAQRAIDTGPDHTPLHQTEGLTDALDPALEQQMKHNLWATARKHLSGTAFTTLWLHYGEGFTNAEIARITRRNRVAVKVMLHRARETLKDAVHREPGKMAAEGDSK